MKQGLVALGNGTNWREFTNEKFGRLLDELSKTELTPTIEVLVGILNEAKRRGMDVRTYGPLSENFVHALTRYNDSKVRTDLVRFNWDAISEKDRDHLVRNTNTSVRLEIATNRIADLTAEQIQVLLVGPEIEVAIAAYSSAFSDSVRDTFESSGLIRSHLDNFRPLVDVDPEVLETIISGPERDILFSEIDRAMAVLIDVDLRTFGIKGSKVSWDSADPTTPIMDR